MTANKSALYKETIGKDPYTRQQMERPVNKLLYMTTKSLSR